MIPTSENTVDVTDCAEAFGMFRVQACGKINVQDAAVNVAVPLVPVLSIDSEPLNTTELPFTVAHVVFEEIPLVPVSRLASVALPLTIILAPAAPAVPE